MNDIIQQLEEQLAVTQRGIDRIILLNKLAEQVYYHDIRRALELNKEAEELAEELDYTSGKVVSILHQAYCNHQLSDNETALKQLLAVLPLVEQEGEMWSETNTLKLIGDIHHRTRNYEDALSFYFRSLRKCIDSEDRARIGSIYVSIGGVYGALEDFDAGMDYYKKALEMFRTIQHEQGEAVCLNNLGGLCLEMKQFDEGLEYLREAVALAERLEYKQILMYSLILMGELYLAKGDLDNSLRHLYQGVRIASTMEDRFAEIECFRNLSKIALQMGDMATALHYCGNALAITQTIDARLERSLLYRLYADIYEKQGDMEQALHYYKEYHALDRELVNAEAQRNSKNLRMQFEVEKSQQEAEIHRLRTVELAQALREIEAANAELKDLNRDKSEFMSIAAHDLRNPLIAINNDARSLYEEFDMLGNEDILRIARRCERSSGQMLALIANLLDYNQMELRQWILSAGTVNWRLTVEQALELFAGKAGVKDINLCSSFSDESLPVLADSTALVQIVENLISNALKFSPPGRSVHVQLQRVANKVQMMVRDEGPGLTEDDKKHLFGKFQRLSARPTAGEESTGLGLSIVKKLAEAMNGAVWCESEYGQGACFIVELPAAVQTNGIAPAVKNMLSGSS
jgi:signal transduction histidine kinase